MGIFDKYLKNKFLRTEPSEEALPVPFYSEDFAVDLGDFTTSGDVVWTRVTDQGNGDLFSAKSGNISHNQVSILQLIKTTAQESTLFQYDYKTSTEGNFDYLHVKVNGVIVARHSGTNAWTTNQVFIHGIGSQTIQFIYYKDTSADGGTDEVWIDNVGLYNYSESAKSNTQTLFSKSLTVLGNFISKGYASFNGISTNYDFEGFSSLGYRLWRMTVRTDGTVMNQYCPGKTHRTTETATLANDSYYAILDPATGTIKIKIGTQFVGTLQNGYIQTAAGSYIRFGENAEADLDKILVVNGDSLFRGTIAIDGGTNQQILLADGSLMTKPKVYTALISQSGTAAPTVTVIENTTGATITWARSTVGSYTATASLAIFTVNKTACIVSGGWLIANTTLKITRSSTTVCVLNSFASGSATDSTLSETFVEIRVYP